MIPNHSPWIKQLNRTRPAIALNHDIETDVVIVGGGIAGVTSAFFALRDTFKKVVLLEGDLIAHGATGHNAGQLTSYFERPLADIVNEFGLELAIDGQRSVESGWSILDLISAETNLTTPCYRFTGYAGISELDQVLGHLKNNAYRVQGGLQPEAIMIAQEWKDIQHIPDEYSHLYTVAPQADILELLETNNSQYIALLAYQKGCMNSALFTEELIGYLLATYPDRFSFFEKSPVKIIRLSQELGVLEIGEHHVHARQVILCTNGFENFDLINESGPQIDTTFHQSVAGRIGYMSGYVEPLDHSPTAISYFPKISISKNDPTGESYFYLTRRPHEQKGSQAQNLVCVGGPDKVLPNGADYSRTDTHSEEIQRTITDFIKDNYAKYPHEETTLSFSWHGLMGYTPNGIRRIGHEPKNPILLYNLGCNGVGILPSLYASQKIARLLNGETCALSIFDPR